MPDVEGASTAVPAGPSATVALGSRVRVQDADGEHVHTVVARVTAAAPLECISVASPVGRALLGRRSGEQVKVQTPGGVRLLTIVDVSVAAVGFSNDHQP
jgi:transcription elongation factor GreA